MNSRIDKALQRIEDARFEIEDAQQDISIEWEELEGYEEKYDALLRRISELVRKLGGGEIDSDDDPVAALEAAVDAKQPFRDKVIYPFLIGYKQGLAVKIEQLATADLEFHLRAIQRAAGEQEKYDES